MPRAADQKAATQRHVDARDLGIRIGALERGELNAITDVPGVRVGHATLIDGAGPLVPGQGPVRTGVTVVLAHGGNPYDDGVAAGPFRLNGNGEMTGLEWIRETGLLASPIALTNTHSLGLVRDALIAHEVASRPTGATFWALPVVAETYDGVLNDINGFHVRAAHVEEALANASDGPIRQGACGAGTGTIAFGFKAGIGTASRAVQTAVGRVTVGVLVQANHGRRERFRVNGIEVGALIGPDEVRLPDESRPGAGSIIGVVATDAPLYPEQCARLARRAALGVARGGGTGENDSGDLFLAFSTAARFPSTGTEISAARRLPDVAIDPLFDASIDATEEAVLNALLGAETMTGRDGIVAHRLPIDRLVNLLSRSA